MSPTQRALAYCRKEGMVAQVVEKWIPQARRRVDLMGCIDMIVLDGAGGGPLGVQVTSGSNSAARVAKAKAEPRLQHWLKAPARFEVWSFRTLLQRNKDGKRGKRRKWELRRVPVTLDDLPSHAKLFGIPCHQAP